MCQLYLQSGQHANLASYSEVFFTIQDSFLYRTRDLQSVPGIHICEQHAFENIFQSPEILGWETLENS